MEGCVHGDFCSGCQGLRHILNHILKAWNSEVLIEVWLHPIRQSSYTYSFRPWTYSLHTLISARMSTLVQSQYLVFYLLIVELLIMFLTAWVQAILSVKIKYILIYNKVHNFVILWLVALLVLLLILTYDKRFNLLSSRIVPWWSTSCVNSSVLAPQNRFGWSFFTVRLWETGGPLSPWSWWLLWSWMKQIFHKINTQGFVIRTELYRKGKLHAMMKVSDSFGMKMIPCDSVWMRNLFPNHSESSPFECMTKSFRLSA